MAGFQVATIPTLANIQAAPRQLHLYDSEGYAAGAAITTIAVFQNPAAFATAGLGVVKQFGRDTSLTNNSALLPQGQYFLWGGISLELHAMNADLGTFANVVFSEQCNRIRSTTYTQFEFDNNPYIYWRSTQLPAAAGPSSIFTTHGGATVYGPNQVQDGRGFPVTVLSNAQKIPPLTGYRVQIIVPALAMTPLINVFALVRLHGTLLRGIRP